MVDNRTSDQKAAVRLLNEQLPNLEGWGGPLKTFAAVEEYLDARRQDLSEIRAYRQEFKDLYLVLVTYMIFRKLELKIDDMSILTKLNNMAGGWGHVAQRSYEFEIRVIERWIKSYKSLFS